MLRCVAVCYSMLQGVTVHFIADMFRGKMMGSQVRGVAVCCSVLQCVAVCCSVLQCAAVCCSVLHVVVVYYAADVCRGSSFAAGRRWLSRMVCCSVLQCVAVCCSVLQCVAGFCGVLQRVAAQDLRDTARHCKTLQDNCSARKCDDTHSNTLESCGALMV